MRWAPTRKLWQRFLRFAAAAALAIGVASLLDRAVFAAAVRLHERLAPTTGGFGILAYGWAILLRLAGSLWVWLVASAAFLLTDLDELRAAGWRSIFRRAAALLACVLLAGALAEGLKLAIRRQRPLPTAGQYAIRPFRDEPFSSAGLGMPSSHAAIALAGAFALSRLLPRSRALWLLVGLGGGAIRVLERAHFLSDVAAAGVLAYGVVWLVWWLTARLVPASVSPRTGP